MPIQGKQIQFDFGFQMTTSGIDFVEKHVHILHWDNCFFLPIWLQNSGAYYTSQRAICLYVRYSHFRKEKFVQN